MKKRNRKNNNKKQYILLFVTFVISTILLEFVPYYTNKDINYSGKVIKKDLTDTLEKENSNNTLLKKNKYNNIVYYLYDENGNLKSYFINAKKNEYENIYSLIKNSEEFDNKINELLNLKYPKFVVNAINTKSDKNYEINSNEMIIHYDNVDVEIQDKLFLKVNFNEIKNNLNIKYTLDSEYTNEDGYNYDSSKKTMAFSFDDGPGGNYTLEILNALAENKAHATFFMLGNRMNNYATVVTTVHNSGNEIGSHTLSHYNIGRTKINKLLEREEETDRIYNSLTGDTLKIMRPPYGIITNKAKEAIDKVIVTWSIDTLDWKTRNKDMIKEEILNNANDGEIVLMHDIYPTTVEAVKEVLPILYSRGYQIVSISELAQLKNRVLEPHNVYYRIGNITE